MAFFVQNWTFDSEQFMSERNVYKQSHLGENYLHMNQ
jgi:hypothetical protein